MYEFGTAEADAVLRVLASQQLFRYLPQAREADTFEKALASRLGAAHALAVSSGTAAIICGLAALGIGPGDEVMIPAYGFVACVLGPLAVGAVPVVCEIDDSLTIDPADLAGKITGRTRAVLPVHVHGYPASMDVICEIARRSELAILEDACQSIGGSYHGRQLGTIGDAGAFSFNQHKILTAGEGGALLTNSTDIYERAFLHHDGSATFSSHQFGQPSVAGLAFRLGEVSAAILNAQLDRLDHILSELRHTRDQVGRALAAAADLTPIRTHDRDGSCGTHLGYLFADAAQAQRFMMAVGDDEICAFQGIGYGHSYPEWTMLHDRRGGHHERRNPLLDTPWAQAADGCPGSVDILSRCVLVKYPIRVGPADVDALHERVARACG